MENKKKMNVSVWVIVMMIITILAIFAVMVMYEIVRETKNDLKEVSNIIVDTEVDDNVEVEENIEEEIIDEEGNVNEEDVKDNTNEVIESNIDKIAQVTIEDYLNLTTQIFASSDEILLKDEFGFYEDYEDMESHVEKTDGEILTDIKYEDFMTKITEYMTKELVESKYNNLYKNVNGYLSVSVRGASGARCDVLDVELLSEDNGVYSYKARYYYHEDGNFKEDLLEKTFKLQKINNNFVVSKEV